MIDFLVILLCITSAIFLGIVWSHQKAIEALNKINKEQLEVNRILLGLAEMQKHLLEDELDETL